MVKTHCKLFTFTWVFHILTLSRETLVPKVRKVSNIRTPMHHFLQHDLVLVKAFTAAHVITLKSEGLHMKSLSINIHTSIKPWKPASIHIPCIDATLEHTKLHETMVFFHATCQLDTSFKWQNKLKTILTTIPLTIASTVKAKYLEALRLT